MKGFLKLLSFLILFPCSIYSQNLEDFEVGRFDDISDFNQAIIALRYNSIYESDFKRVFGNKNINQIDFEELKRFKTSKTLLLDKYSSQYKESIRLDKTTTESVYNYELELLNSDLSALASIKRRFNSFPPETGVFIYESLSEQADLYLGDNIITPDSAKLENITNAISLIEERIEELEEESGTNEYARFRGLRDTLRINIALLQEDINFVDSKIAEKLEPLERQSNFNRTIIMLFAVLIAIMIISFFATIYFKSEDPVVISLLSNEGLQFVTIFVLIIAIVLFGTLQILEGRELAAIISGISGYILGRRTTEKKLDPDTVLKTIASKKSGSSTTDS